MLKKPKNPDNYNTRKPQICISIYPNNKDKVPLALLNKSHVTYKFSCPGCQSSYISKINRTLFTLTREHAVSDTESAIYKHLRTCEHLTFIQNLINLPNT